jgi:predicted RNA methylase
MNHNQDEATRNYVHFQHTLQYQESMLGDRSRNRAFYKALQKRVTRGATVLDIGSGTGIWAITAARLGAAKVVAIEKEPLLIPVIKGMVRENGVEDCIELLQGDSRDIKLKEKFDLVISETIGNQGFDEGIVPILIDARKRFLKPGGAMIPSVVSLFVAPAHLKHSYRTLPEGVPVEGRYMEFVCQNLPIRLNDTSQLKFVGEPVELMRVDLTTIESPPDFEAMTARWKLAGATGLNCFAVWAEVILTTGVKLKTLETSSWKPVVYKVEPIKSKKRHEIEFKLSLNDQHTVWSMASPGEEDTERSYSPVFPYMSIHAHLK